MIKKIESLIDEALKQEGMMDAEHSPDEIFDMLVNNSGRVRFEKTYHGVDVFIGDVWLMTLYKYGNWEPA